MRSLPILSTNVCIRSRTGQVYKPVKNSSNVFKRSPRVYGASQADWSCMGYSSGSERGRSLCVGIGACSVVYIICCSHLFMISLGWYPHVFDVAILDCKL